MSGSVGRFTGKSVVVTGAAQDIGRAVAEAFSAEGGRLVVVDNESDALAQSNVFLSRIPLGRFAAPDEMAKPILWMCSDDATYLNGELMVVDAGMTAGLPEPGEMDEPLPGAIR